MNSDRLDIQGMRAVAVVAASVQDRFLTRISRSLAVDLLQVGCALALVLSFKFGSELWYVPGHQALARWPGAV